MSTMAQDQQSIQCCGSMPCEPSNQHHACCKSMVSSQSPSVLPTAHVSLLAPVLFVADVLPSLQIPQFFEVASFALAAPERKARYGRGLFSGNANEGGNPASE